MSETEDATMPGEPQNGCVSILRIKRTGPFSVGKIQPGWEVCGLERDGARGLELARKIRQGDEVGESGSQGVDSPVSASAVSGKDHSQRERIKGPVTLPGRLETTGVLIVLYLPYGLRPQALSARTLPAYNSWGLDLVINIL